MGGLVEVPGRVLSGRVVAAPDMAARGAAPQVTPHASGQQALHTAVTAGCGRPDLVEMRAAVGHGCSLAEASRAEYSRDTARVEELLSLARDFPRRTLEAGDVLLVDGEPVEALYVLLEGGLRVEKGGVLVATVTVPGACVGEMSLLLGVPATAGVTAGERSVLAVIENAHTMLEGQAGLPLALARLLAARLHVMTTYLADVKQQYADHEGGLGMVDVVLGSLMQSSGTRSELGSERDPDPEY